jgi:signal recognition particle GTPase
VCCPQINREGNNNNNCWQSVSSVVGGVNVRCSTSSSDRRVGFLGRLGRVFKEKAKSDIQLLFSGFSKTRENLAVVDELLTYWNLSDSENILDELEEVLLVSDFGPRTAMKIVDGLRKDILKGTLKSGPDIKVALKRIIVRLLTENVSSTELQLGQSRPAVIMIVGVNGGGKTTTIGKLAHRFKNENVKVTPSEQQPVSSWRFGLRGQVQRLWWERDQNPDLQQFWQKLSAKVWNKILT